MIHLILRITLVNILKASLFDSTYVYMEIYSLEIRNIILSRAIFTNFMYLCTNDITATLSMYHLYYYLLNKVKKQQHCTVAKSLKTVRAHGLMF